MFIAHKNSIKENSYIPLLQYNNEKVLSKNDNIKIVSNVCPHQGSIISTCAGKGTRQCPYHGWTFSVDGTPIGSGRTGSYCKNVTPLAVHDTYEWNSLIFSEPVEFCVDIDFKDMELVEQRVDKVNSCSASIMDLFLDVDHIPLIHKGVYDRIGLHNILEVNWDYFENGSVQRVVDNAGSVGALWIALYPGTMIEWQKGALFITVALDSSTDTSNVLVFKYKDKLLSNDLWELNEDVWETAWLQDKSQAEIITHFCHQNIEPQKEHYRKFLSKNGFSVK